MQNIVTRPFFVYGGCLFVGVALRNCSNNCNVTLGHNKFFTLQTIYTNWVRRLAVSQIKKVGKQKFCIQNLLPDFNF